MLNHFRTILLNLTSETEDEHIPEEFKAVNLPAGLEQIYNQLFPADSSRFFKLFLVNNYLNIIESADLTSEVVKFDNRISYDLKDTSYFKIHRISNPKISNSKFPLFVYGKLESLKDTDYSYDAFQIRQVSNSTTITIYSRVNGVYLKGRDKYQQVGDALISLDLSNPQVTTAVNVGATGLYFVIGTGESFTGTSDKTWDFFVEAPYQFDFKAVFDKINALRPFDVFRKYQLDLTKFENIWNLHYNPLYKFAAFLIAYGQVVNSL